MSEQAAPHRPENYYADADWAKYAQLRPHYPAEIFFLLSSYLDQYNPAKAGARRAIDYGSGSGVIVRDLLERCGVDQVLATDLNANALEEGQRILGPELGERYSTLAGRAGHLDPKDVPDESFDLVVSAEAAHWFDQEEWIKEAHRILRPGGTLCAWFYPFPAYILDCPAAVYPLWRMWLCARCSEEAKQRRR
ncbi:S-adenosyl-L-methionine-dependent methyltransferase [Jaminaea rosea]|uniref:S-adenosyl-L-methionine-dependent methyltransferase n=1 Tax=Jaminaea rosea TaxID=1569628 RepID=A0A316UPL5_9BASI|nr:S-adenosyl-L-methionine-dependent methyltransferase [Jaminaea rosea]PWN27237.1 S-adenosyl-L-methionine-dependent methyltransferase [Jaminaea rosea]